MTGWIEGSVSILRCEPKGHLTPYLTLIGDTDMITAGIGSLSSVAIDEIVVAELGASELIEPLNQGFEDRSTDCSSVMTSG